MWVFDKLIWSVMSYGVKICGWRKREKMKKIEKRYIRMDNGVERGTPRYMVREEIQRENLRERSGRTA